MVSSSVTTLMSNTFRCLVPKFIIFVALEVFCLIAVLLATSKVFVVLLLHWSSIVVCLTSSVAIWLLISSKIWVILCWQEFVSLCLWEWALISKQLVEQDACFIKFNNCLSCVSFLVDCCLSVLFQLLILLLQIPFRICNLIELSSSCVDLVLQLSYGGLLVITFRWQHLVFFL